MPLSSPASHPLSVQYVPPVGGRVVAGVLAALYLALTALHLLVLPAGPARTVMPVLALATALVAGACWYRWRDHEVPRWGLELLALAPVTNALAHLGLTGEIEQTTIVMLSVVAIGAGIPSRLAASALITILVGGWVALLPLTSAAADQRVHHAIQLAIALVVAGALHELLARREAVLRDARDDLSAQVALAERAHATLETSEARFRGVFAASPVGIGLSDERGLFLTANAALCELLGRSEAELVGRSAAEFTHPDDLTLHARAREIIESAPGQTARVEKRYLRPSGEVRWAWLTVSLLDNADGTRWTLAHVQDVTERKAAERALADSEANLAAVARVVRRLRSGDDARTTILEAARLIAGANSATLIEREGDELVVTGSENLDVVGMRIPLSSHSATVHCWETRLPLFLADAASSPLTNPAYVELAGAVSMMWHPVIADGELVAILNANWTHRVDSIEDRAAAAVSLLADEAAVALVHDDLLRRYTHLATTDTLTGLPNRRAWEQRIPQLLALADRSGRPLVLAIADLDHFKAYNDLFGHVQGDVLLRALGEAISSELRGGDVAARWGGEEFTLALPACTEDEAHLVLERIRSCAPDGQTLSIGFASWDGLESASVLLDRADQALYLAKAAGRNQVVSATSPLLIPRAPGGSHVPVAE